MILGCTHDVLTYNSVQCCHKIFGNRTYVTDLATMCVSTAKQAPLEEIFASQVYGLTVYLKTNTRDRFGNLIEERVEIRKIFDRLHSILDRKRRAERLETREMNSKINEILFFNA